MLLGSCTAGIAPIACAVYTACFACMAEVPYRMQCALCAQCMSLSTDHALHTKRSRCCTHRIDRISCTSCIKRAESTR
eukprot:6142343-Lingulodinium_polyedra.AAC.1